MSVAISSVQCCPDVGRGAECAQVGPRLEQKNVTDSQRTWGVLMHLSRIADIFIPIPVVTTLVLWLVRKKSSAFEDDHGRDALNFSISLIIYHFLLGITIIGIVLFPVLWIVAIISTIRGAVAAGNGEYFRYPMSIRFLS